MKKPKIGIVGWFGYGNVGDEAMKDIMQDFFPGSIVSHKGEIDKDCDAYILAGGALVYGGKNGFYMYEFFDSLNKDIPLYATSLGVNRDWRKRYENSSKMFERFKMVYTRDKFSFDEIKQFKSVISEMPDIVLLADAPKSKHEYGVLFNYSDINADDPNGQFEDIMANNDNLHPIAVMPQDLQKYADKHVTYKELISMAKSSKGLIGTRLHSVVLGAVAGVPLLGIGYADKTKRFCKKYGIRCLKYGKKYGKITGLMRMSSLDLEAERKEIKVILNKIKEDIELSVDGGNKK